jgi:hypothetical protein
MCCTVFSYEVLMQRALNMGWPSLERCHMSKVNNLPTNEIRY